MGDKNGINHRLRILHIGFWFLWGKIVKVNNKGSKKEGKREEGRRRKPSE